MQASEIVRVAVAHLQVGDEIPIAGISAAIPHFFVRATAICVERRQLGIVQEFLMRGIAFGFTVADELSGFLGVHIREVEAELLSLGEEFFVNHLGVPPKYSLMERGKEAISVLGLPQVTEREVACYVNGITRNTEQFAGELLPKRRLSSGTIALPSIPARPPRVEELDVARVKAAMQVARNVIPRVVEISRMGRIIRTSTLYSIGQLLLRRGLHGVPLVIVNGAVDADLARPMGAHPGLSSVKAQVEKSEKEIHRLLVQLRPKLRSAALPKPEAVLRALSRFVALSDADDASKVQARADFVDAVDDLRRATHWVSGLEVQVLFASTLMMVQRKLIVVMSQVSDCFGPGALEGIGEAMRRSIKVEMHLPASQIEFFHSSEIYRDMLRGTDMVLSNGSSEWFGFCADDGDVTIGASRTNTTLLGRCESFFGVLLVDEPQPYELLRNLGAKGGTMVTVKPKRRLASSTHG